MGQTGTIAFALIVGFVVFVTVRGELPTYLGVIGLGNVKVNPPASSGNNLGGTVGSAVGGAVGNAAGRIIGLGN